MVQGNADTFWKFQRYHLIAEYQERPALAPPFIVLSHLSLVLKRVSRKQAEQKRARLGEAWRRARRGGRGGAPRAPQLGRLCPPPRACCGGGRLLPGPGSAPEAAPAFPERDLPEPLDQKMVTWEAVQKENFLSKTEKRRKDSGEELLRKTAHRCAAGARSPGRCSGWTQVALQGAGRCRPAGAGPAS